MVEKLHSNLEKKEGYTRPKSDALEFAVAHYAGRVTYEARGFLEKNRDAVPIDVIACLRQSDGDLVAELFGASEEDRRERKRTGKRVAGAKVGDVCLFLFVYFVK